MLSRFGTAALASLLCLHSSVAIGQVALSELKGARLGTMQIPDGPRLRVGVEIFEKADGRWGGNVASLDQGVRYMLVSGVEVSGDTVTVQLAGASVGIGGRFDRDAGTITGMFTQEGKAFRSSDSVAELRDRATADADRRCAVSGIRGPHPQHAR
ncbi:MAG: hypothetical protein R3F08_03885 [Dokdonella sp.]